MKHSDLTEILKALQGDDNLGKATADALTTLAANATRRTFAKGAYIFETGDKATHYYLVETGRVVLTRESPTGKAFTFRIAGRGTPLNAVTCFRDRPRFFSARVAEPTTVLAITCEIFRTWVLDNPIVADGIINAMGDLLDGAYTRILDIIDGSVEERILNALTMLSARIGPDLPLTNADVADLVGTSRETAARVISRLQEFGLITKTRGKITIINQQKLDDASTSPFFIL